MILTDGTHVKIKTFFYHNNALLMLTQYKGGPLERHMFLALTPDDMRALGDILHAAAEGEIIAPNPYLEGQNEGEE